MLQVLLPLTRGADIDARWLVIEGDPEFFEITKRLHIHLHGQPGDGRPCSMRRGRALRAASCGVNTDELSAFVVEDDVVILHDPQTAGMAEFLSNLGVPVVWRCHVGIDGNNEWTGARVELPPSRTSSPLSTPMSSPEPSTRRLGSRGPAAHHPPEHRSTGAQEPGHDAGRGTRGPRARRHHRWSAIGTRPISQGRRHTWPRGALRRHHLRPVRPRRPMRRWWCRSAAGTRSRTWPA